MATLTIRNLPDDVRDWLRVRAAQAGHSMEAEARAPLCDTVGRLRMSGQDKLAAWYDFQSAVLAGLPPERRQLDSVDEFLRDKRRDQFLEMILDGDDPRTVFGGRFAEAIAEASQRRGYRGHEGAGLGVVPVIVIDTSAIVAFLRNEPGREVVVQYLPEGCLSTVLVAETIARTERDGMTVAATMGHMRKTGISIVPFDEAQSEVAGKLWRSCKAAPC